VSAAIATEVAELAYQRDLARKPKPEDLAASISSIMYYPEYQLYA
jgi:hypothetical protein